MSLERTGAGDPLRTIELLWPDPEPQRPRRGPVPRLGPDEISGAAVRLADADGLGGVTLRKLAEQLGLSSPAALYTYVPGKAELVDLMVDAAFGGFVLDVGSMPPRIPDRISAIADANRALHDRHRWLVEVSVDRPPLGPGQLRKYDLELAALDGLGLSDHEMDLALGLVLAFVRWAAASALNAASAAEEAAWWAAAGPALGRRVAPGRFPFAARIGSAAGERQGRAHDPDLAYRFGLERIIAGIEALKR